MATDRLYAQFGCGFCAPDGWLNFDASPTLRLKRVPIVGRLVRRGIPFPANVRYGDIVRGLPVPDASCAGLFGSHILEHLALDEFRMALANSYRHLRPNGILRVIVPDLEAGARAYLASLETQPNEAALTFVRGTFGEESRPRGLMRRIVSSVGNTRHRWMWDYAGLAHELDSAGFVRIRRCEFGDCDDLQFRDVEDRIRFQGAVAAECRRAQ